MADGNRIRVAHDADLPAIETIVQAAYACYVPRIGRKPAPMLADYASLIRAGSVSVLDDGRNILGMIVLIAETDAMLLDNIAVSPAAQGRGYGRMLLQFVEQAARDAGYARLKLYTNEAMTENLALYAGIGFVETHRTEENGFRRVYLEKRLD